MFVVVDPVLVVQIALSIGDSVLCDVDLDVPVALFAPVHQFPDAERGDLQPG